MPYIHEWKNDRLFSERRCQRLTHWPNEDQEKLCRLKKERRRSTPDDREFRVWISLYHDFTLIFDG